MPEPTTTTTAVTLLLVLAFLWAFWAIYVLVMGVYRAHLSGRLSWIGYALGLPIVAVGYVMDILTNATIASLVFLEPPHEWLVTDRLKRHINSGMGTWRGWLAAWICDTLLDVFDLNGRHC